MWVLLSNLDQLVIGSQLKQSNLYVEPSVDTFFIVDYVGEHYFSIRAIKSNNLDIDIENQISFIYQVGCIPFVEFMIDMPNITG